MASLEEAITVRLNSFAALTALVADRISPAPLAQGSVLPAVTYQKISGPQVHAMGSDGGLTYPRFQFTCLAEETGSKGAYLNALDVAAQVRAALRRFRGTVAGVVIQDCFIVGEGDLPRDDLTALRARYVDVEIWAQES